MFLVSAVSIFAFSEVARRMHLRQMITEAINNTTPEISASGEPRYQMITAAISNPNSDVRLRITLKLMLDLLLRLATVQNHLVEADAHSSCRCRE